MGMHVIRRFALGKPSWCDWLVAFVELASEFTMTWTTSVTTIGCALLWTVGLGPIAYQQYQRQAEGSSGAGEPAEISPVSAGFWTARDTVDVDAKGQHGQYML